MLNITNSQPKPQLKFASTMRFVTQEEFGRTIRNGEYPGFELGLSAPLKEGFTDTTMLCSSGGIVGRDSFRLFHFFPGSNKRNEEKAQLLQDSLKHIRKADPRQRLFFIGTKQDIPESKDLGDRILSLFKQQQLPVTYLVGQTFIKDLHKLTQYAMSIGLPPERAWEAPVGYSDIAYSMADDTWTIHGSYVDTDQSVKDVLTYDDLCKAYQTRKVARKDEIMLADGVLDSEGYHPFAASQI